MENENTMGVIYDIQKMCTNDGPGFRTTVFLKGCTLDCQWCHNPEGKTRYPQVIPFVSNCTNCGECQTVCATGALSINGEGHPQIDRGLCSTCLECVRVCRESGLVVWGQFMTAQQVMEEVEKDKPFYRQSGGGMTISGGEPMAQPGFVRALLELAKKDPDPAERIHTALDTCGYASWEDYKQVLELVDIVLLDIKHMDTEAHRAYTGAGNERILDNARRMSQTDTKIRIRVPVIPGTNDKKANWIKTAEFAESLGDAVIGLDLLPYHPYAGGKYKAFGMPYDFPTGQGYDDELLRPVIELFLDHVEEVTVGG